MDGNRASGNPEVAEARCPVPEIIRFPLNIGVGAAGGALAKQHRAGTAQHLDAFEAIGLAAEHAEAARGLAQAVQVVAGDQTLEGNLVTGAVKHKLLLGVDYLHYKQTGSAAYPAATQIDVYNPVYTGFTFNDLSLLAANTQKQNGLYVQYQMHLTSKLLLTVGLRHDRARNETEGAQTQRSSATTRRAGLMYLSDSGVSPYVSYSESFTPVANSAQATRPTSPPA